MFDRLSDSLSGTIERVTYFNPENGYSVLKVMPFIIKALTTIKHLLTAAAAREPFLQGLRQNWVGIAAGIAAATTTSLMFADTMKDAANSSKEMAMNMHEVEAAVTRAGQAYQRANGFSISSIHGPGRPAQPFGDCFSCHTLRVRDAKWAYRPGKPARLLSFSRAREMGRESASNSTYSFQRNF